MRIAGGEFKGRIFVPDKKFKARPTTDLAKEGLFNILSNRYFFEDKNALDLFSGTGSIGYEFLSRGCHEVYMVEKNPNHCTFIHSVTEKLQISNAKIIRGDALKFILSCKQKFNFIFADPPFDSDKINDIPDLIFNSGILKPDGLFILEHPGNFNFSKHHAFSETRNYGKVNFSFFENAPS